MIMRNKYKDSYQKVTGLDAGGRLGDQYIYIGGHYVLPFDARKKRNTSLIQFGLFAPLAAVVVLAGMVNPSSSRTFWVVYPYLFLYLPLLYLLLGLISYLDCGLRIQVDVYDKSIRRIRHSVWGIIVMAGIAALCDVVYLILYHGQIDLFRELFYLGFLVAAAVLGIGYGFCYDRMFSGIVLED